MTAQYKNSGMQGPLNYYRLVVAHLFLLSGLPITRHTLLGLTYPPRLSNTSSLISTRKINFEEERDLPHIIEVPSAIIVALRDPYLKPYQSEKMHKFVPNLKRVMIDAEHFVMTEKPDEINALIKELLEDVKSRRVKSVL